MYNIRIIPIFKVLIKDGVFSMIESESSRFKKMCLSMSGDFEMIIRKKFNKRSRSQDGWYFGLVIPMLADEMGETDLPYVHACMKDKFLSKTKVDKKGIAHRATGRYAKLNTEQAGNFIEKVRAFAAEFYFIDIPDPDKEWSSNAVLLSEFED